MHDPYYNDLDPEQLGTVDMVKYIVPKLKAEGFTFTRVDKVPQIAALLPPLQEGTPSQPENVPDPGKKDPSAPAASDNPCR